MAFPDSAWPCGCDFFSVHSDSSEEATVNWDLGRFLRGYHEERKELRSVVFGFAGATWNLFTSFDRKEVRSLFGINVKPHRLSDAVFDCNCQIEFKFEVIESEMYTKKIECEFKYESADSHWSAENFLSYSELENVLREDIQYCVIRCIITVKKSSIKEACPQAETETSHPSSSSAEEAHNETQTFENSTWPCGCDSWYACLYQYTNSKNMVVKWDISSFLHECQESKKELRSYDFGIAGARWNLCISLDQKKVHTLIGINFKPYRFWEAVFDCKCHISLIDNEHQEIKSLICRFKCGSADSYWAMENFLSKVELEKFLHEGRKITCSISLKKLSIKEACPGAESTHSSCSGAVEDQTETQLPQSKNKEIPETNPLNKVCHDLKQLMLSEEYSDVTLQVQDQQFKAHRSILAARSSVFAATFSHDMKEKATGIVDVEDCNPSSFPVLLEFIYTGCTDKLSVENVFSLYTSADKYDIQELKLECLEFIQNNLSIETFCETVRLSLMHSESSLLKQTIDFFTRNMKKIIVTAKWQSFILENPIQGNEMLIKALGADS